jgi:hypothetical protein
MTQQEGAHLPLVYPDRFDCGRPGSDQVAHRFVRWIGNPHRRQLAGPQQTRERGRIPTVRLHALARLAGNERGRSHRTRVAEFGDQTMQPIARRTGLVTEMQPLVL